MEQLLGHGDAVVAPLHVGQQHHELVAAHACNGVCCTDAQLEPLGNPLQQLVPDGVSEAVVDALEAIKVKEHHSDSCASSSCVGQGDFESVVEHRPVRQPRQGIMVGAELGAGAFLDLSDQVHGDKEREHARSCKDHG